MNSNSNIRNDNQKTKPVLEELIQNVEKDKGIDTASGDTKRDSKSPITKKIKISECGDADNTLYISCTEFDTSETFMDDTSAYLTLETASTDTTLETASTDITLETASTNTTLATASTNTTLETASTNATLETASTNTSLETASTDTTLETASTDTTLETAIGDSTLEITIAESSLNGTVTNSSLDETLAETSWDNTLSRLTINSSFGKPPSEDTSLDESLKRLVDEIGSSMDPDIKGDDCDTTAYFSLDSSTSSDVQHPFQGLPTVLKKDYPFNTSNRIWTLFNEYREYGYISSETSSSFLQPDESWMCDTVIVAKDDENIKELEVLMSKLKVSGHDASMELPDEKERSLEVVENIRENFSDEYGPDVETTNLLLLARQSLESYVEIEEQYIQREIRARNIVRRRFHVTLEEFFSTINEGIEKKEGLDRFEKFLEEVDKAAFLREQCDKMKENLANFNVFKILKNLQRPFRSQDEKDAYFMATKYSALYLHAAKVNKVLSKRRGYESV